MEEGRKGWMVFMENKHWIKRDLIAGLGVDINTANYSMSELNIAINAQHLKQVPQL